MHADASASGDENVAIVEWVAQLRQAIVVSRRGRIELGRALHGERLVRSFGVELLDEGIEAGLLLQAVCAWRAGGLLLEGEMHAFMAAVLLRMARFDALDLDAQA